MHSFMALKIGSFRVVFTVTARGPSHKLTEIFRDVSDYHAPIKQMIFTGYRLLHVPFMLKKLSRAIMDKLKIKNKYFKWPS